MKPSNKLYYFSNSACRGKDIDRIPLPPPLYGAASFNSPKTSRQYSSRPSAPSSRHDVSTNPPATSASDNQVRYSLFSLAIGSVFRGSP